MKKLILLILIQTLCCIGIQAQLVINEIQVANLDRFIDPSYNYGGWIELYNAGETSVSLVRCYVSDDPDSLKKFRIPAAMGSVPAGGFKTIWFDHNSNDGSYGGKSAYNVNFKLKASGGTIYLSNMSGVLMAEATYPACVPRCSYALTEDGGTEWAFTSTPTPDASNAGSTFASERLEAPVVSREGGVFAYGQKISFSVTIPEGATLRYTTDGSTPSLENGLTSQDGRFSVQETSVYRFMLYQDGFLPSPVVTRSFIYKNHEYYLPVISVATAPENLFDSTIGLYTKGTNGVSGNGVSTACNWNRDWERPVNVEYMTPSENQDGEYITRINHECNFEIAGGWSRSLYAGSACYVDGKYWELQSSFRLKCEKAYDGENSLDYPVFPNKPYCKYRVWQVRNGGNDYNRIIDAALNQIVLRSGFYVDAQDCQPAHIFFNGDYLGMFNIRESNNRHYGYSNYGIDTDDMDQFDLSGGQYNQKVGDKTAWNKLVSLARQLSSDQSESTYQEICQRMDMDEYINYMALEVFLGSDDWINNNNNFKGFRCREDGKFHFVFFDVDQAYRKSAHSHLNGLMTDINYSSGSNVDELFYYLAKYPPFLSQFSTAIQIVDGSVLNPEKTSPIVEEMFYRINEAMGFENKYSSTYISYQINSNHNSSRLSRLSTLLNFGGAYQLNLGTNISEGHLSLNGQEIPYATFSGQAYAPIKLTAKAPAGYRFVGWKQNGAKTYLSTEDTYSLSDAIGPSTITIQAVFSKIEDEKERLQVGATPIRINEVSAGNDIYINDNFQKKDWIELYNTTDEDIDMAGMYLSDKQDNPQKYQISARAGVSTIISAHGTRIVWCDGDEATSQLHAPFKLENCDSACVSIQAENGSWTDRLIYMEQPRWTTYGRYPDGGNYYCLLLQPTIDKSNRLGTYDFEAHAEEWKKTPVSTIHSDNEIASLQYFSLSGQRLARPAGICIIKTIYKDGTFTTRKLRIGD